MGGTLAPALQRCIERPPQVSSLRGVSPLSCRGGSPMEVDAPDRGGHHPSDDPFG